MSRPEDFIVFYLGGIPFTASELGDDLLDEDIRTVFQSMIDRNMIPGLDPGTPWFNHIRLDGVEKWEPGEGDDELTTKLLIARKEAEAAYLANRTDETRAALADAHKRVKMARKLIAD